MNQSIDLALLQKACKIPGAPGYEHRIRDAVREEIAPFVHEHYTDRIGNLFGIVRGRSDRRVMVAAHLDEIGFIVTHIDNDGFLRVHPLGGFDPKTLTAQRVIVHGKEDIIGVMGSKPIHVMTEEERAKLPKLTDYFVDLGLRKEEVLKYVSIGSVVTREREMIEIGDCVNSKSIDNRVSVYILIEALRELQEEELPFTLYAAFTVQEEVGLRGATVAAHTVEPEWSIALDTTVAYDLPGARAHEKITSLGEGVAIKVMDASVICDARMVRYMEEQAVLGNIPFQKEILTAGGTDTGMLQRMGKHGSIAGALSLPTRHLHQVIEMVHKADVRSCIELLKRCLRNLDGFEW